MTAERGETGRMGRFQPRSRSRLPAAGPESAEVKGRSPVGSARSQTTNFPSFCSGSPSTVMLPPARRSQIMSQWIAELLVPPVSG